MPGRAGAYSGSPIAAGQGEGAGQIGPKLLGGGARRRCPAPDGEPRKRGNISVRIGFTTRGGHALHSVRG